jgi:release factor glutamine methyltransferase
MQSVLEILQKTTDFFAQKGVENPRFNAELIVGHALGLKRMQLYLQFERLLSEPDLEKMRLLVRRRASREPLAYVLGETEFYGLKLKTDRRALIPRPETEELVELVVTQLKTAPTPPQRLADLGTGTGCIALALAASFPESSFTALDASDEALALARENAVACKLEDRVSFLKSDWLSALPSDERFDAIVSNPPYLTEQEAAETQPEVQKYEPHAALASPDEGIADLRKIIQAAPAYLKPGALLALETGIDQHAKLLELMAAAGFVDVASKKDLSGRDRFVTGLLRE